MRAGYAVAPALAAMRSAAMGLRADDIPVECARMCGPVVELVSACTLCGDQQQKQQRRRTVARRELVVIVDVPGQAPASETKSSSKPKGPGPGVAAETPSTSTRIAKSPSSSSSPSPPITASPVVEGTKPEANTSSAATPAATPSSTTSKPPPPPPPSTSTMVLSPPPPPPSPPEPEPPEPEPPEPEPQPQDPLIAGSDGMPPMSQRPAGQGGQKGSAVNAMPRGAEENCVCTNKSFNVSLVTALCESCISQSGDNMNNVDSIVSTCQFPSADYAVGNESLVDNIRVSATRPTESGSPGCGTSGAARAGAGAGAARGVLCVAVVAALLL